jgi:putative nucleotidyltransferase with HDIG domain
MPETTIAQAFERAEIVRKRVEALEFTVPTSMTPIRVTLSLGVAHRENFSQSQEQITHNADLALYHSKLDGRNRTYGFVNDTYLDRIDPGKVTEDSLAGRTGNPAVDISLTTTTEDQNSKRSGSIKTDDEAATPPAADFQPKTDNEKISKKPPKVSRNMVTVFISGLALLAILSVTILTLLPPYNAPLQTFDWLGMSIILGLIILSEIFSVDLYVRQSSISTSAIPILVGYLLFGIGGVILASLVLAISLLIKFRSPLNRFVFNLSNHLLSGSLVVGLVVLTGKPFLNLPAMYQVGICIAGAGILYFVTTWMVAVGIGLDLKKPIRQLWREQFGWLAPYYLGIGLITYALIFGYIHNQIIGLLLMIIPMVLLRISQKQYIDRTRAMMVELSEKNQIMKKKSDEMNELNEGLLTTLSEIIDLRDPYVFGHSKQVSNYAAHIANLMGLNEKQVDLIRRAGLLHDIGKLGIPMEILSKPGKLSNDEYAIVMEHAALGGDLVKNNPSLRQIATIIRHHHEHFDGSGYPDKIAGNKIPIEARILAVADAIEVMITDRPYRKALKVQTAVEELKKHSGTQFDPIVVESAIRMMEEENTAEEKKISPQTDTQVRVSKIFATHRA